MALFGEELPQNRKLRVTQKLCLLIIRPIRKNYLLLLSSLILEILRKKTDWEVPKETL
jgi:hypothetical protein